MRCVQRNDFKTLLKKSQDPKHDFLKLGLPFLEAKKTKTFSCTLKRRLEKISKSLKTHARSTFKNT